MSTRQVWMYKWNDKGEFHQGLGRDWNKVFEESREHDGYGFDTPIGRTLLPKVHPRDLLIAYQTNTTSAVGLCEVTRVEPNHAPPCLWFRPLERFAAPVKLHELKKSDPRLRAVDALRAGPVQSLYEMTPEEAEVVLAACGLDAKRLKA